MAKRWSSYGPGALAAGCVALLLSGCSLPAPEAASPPATGGSAGSSAPPLALLPATMPGTPPTGEAAKTGRMTDKPRASPDPDSSAGPAVAPVTAYFVLVDDGGRHGVRFGCNDSLVGSVRPGGAGDARLKAAITALLDDGQHHGNTYNALGASRLRFLSGSFDGTTVTVYLSGTLNPGGTCDVPRIEAQLTQTALEAVGAIRADIYINGETLADYLKLK